MAGRWADVREAAEALDITTDAVRKRIARGSLDSERRDGTVYVWLDGGGLGESDTRTSSTTGADELVEAKDETIRLLTAQLEAERRANEENRRIIAGLVQRVPELQPPAEAQEKPQSRTEEQAETSTTTPEAGVGQERNTRPWWKIW